MNIRKNVYDSCKAKIRNSWKIDKDIYRNRPNYSTKLWLDTQEDILNENIRRLDEPGVLDALIAQEARSIVATFCKSADGYNGIIIGDYIGIEVHSTKIQEIIDSLQGVKINRGTTNEPEYSYFTSNNLKDSNSTEYDRLVEGLYKEMGGDLQLFICADVLKEKEQEVNDKDGVEKLKAEKELRLSRYASGIEVGRINGAGAQAIPTPLSISQEFDHRIELCRLERLGRNIKE